MPVKESQRPSIAGHDLGPIVITVRPAVRASLLTSSIDSADWPDGLLEHYWYAGTDGKSKMSYSQWRNRASLESFATGRGASGITDFGPEPLDYFTLYRRMLGTTPDALPGCIVLVTFDVVSASIQKTLVDTIISVVEGAAITQPGSISSNFHINVAGTTVVNHAEFVDEASHEAVVRSRLQGNGSVMSAIAQMDGVTPRGFQRFVPVGGQAWLR